MTSCTYIPSKGADLFKQLKRQFGYELGREIFLRVISPRFINNFKGTLSLNTEGIPSFESVMKNPWIKKFIGNETLIKSLNTFEAREDTLDNYTSALDEAKRFNNDSPHKDDLIATVEYTKEGKLQVQVSERTPEKVERFNNQFGVQSLNNSLSVIFKDLGLTVGMLTKAEIRAGRVGSIDFSKARDVASGFNSLIRVANNMEGAQAISEEFSHLMVELFKNNPLVVRALNTLTNNPSAIRDILGEQYEDVLEFHNNDASLVAEEALGQLLQKNLLKAHLDKYQHKSLFRRVIDTIVNKFKSFSTSDVDKAIQEADNAMSEFAKNILSNTVHATKEDVERIKRDTVFNSLSDRVNRNIKILKDAINIESKRLKINPEAHKDTVRETINELRKYTGETTDTIQGLVSYTQTALSNLNSLYSEFATINEKNIQQRCAFLRNVQQYLQSYGEFISALNTAITEEQNLEDNMFSRIFQGDEGEFTLSSLITDLNNLNARLKTQFMNTAIPTFAEFLQPYLEGTDIEVMQLISQAESDISFLDRWLDSMGTSSDVLLQAFDMAAKKAKDTARLNTIDTIKRIQLWMKKAESLGITSFDWCYEVNSEGRKTGNYISEVNVGEFEYQYNKFLQELDEKYGKNPSGDIALQKIEEKKNWISKYAYSYYGKIHPKPTLWQNQDYANLSKEQKELLEEYLAIKAELDKLIPEKKLTSGLAIQIRKSSGQRFIDATTSPSTLFSNIKESFKSGFFDSADDDQIFGAKVRRGLTNFDGSEYMVLPIQYTNRLENPEELSTDMASNLMAYAYMANQYSELEKILDPLEVGKTIVKEYRKVKKTRGNSPLVEKVESLGNKVYLDVMHSDGTNIAKKLEDFMESQIYQRYIKDEGTIGNSKFNTAKTINKALQYSSLAQLGFNWLANIANVTQGIAMQHIESAAGQYFKFSELLSADKEYAAMMKDFVPEIGARNKNSKMALLGEFFNIKQDFASTTRRTKKKNLLERVFGSNVAFLGQEAGDHWLYYRTAIAYMKHTKILVDGQETTVWDALQIDEVEAGSGVKIMSMPKAKNLDGTDFNPTKFGRQIAHINHSLFGVYNEEDANAANRVALGRLLMQYRKWMKPLYNKRFQKATYNLEMNVTEEGYYRTLLRVAQELIRGEVRLGALKEELSEQDYQNVKRSLFELVQFFCVLAAAELIDWPDDEDRPWGLKLAEYTTHRLAHELGGLTPSPTMVNEVLKTVKTPMAILSTIQSTANLANSLLDPRDWTDELQSGPYEGMSTLEKNFIKAPIPGVAQYRQITRFTGDLDNSIMYYLRPY